MFNGNTVKSTRPLNGVEHRSLADVEQGLIGKEFRHVRLDFWRHINLLIVSRLDVEGESGLTCLSWTIRWRTALGSAWKRRVWKIGTSSGLTVVECCEPLLNWEEPVVEGRVRRENSGQKASARCCYDVLKRCVDLTVPVSKKRREKFMVGRGVAFTVAVARIGART